VTARVRALLLFTAAAIAAIPAGAQTPEFRPLSRVLGDARAAGGPLPGNLATPVVMRPRAAALGELLRDLTRQAGIAVVYPGELADGPMVRTAPDTLAVGDALLVVTRGTGWTPWADGAGAVVVRRDSVRRAPDGERARVSGFVRSAETREVVRYASLLALPDSIRGQSSADGSFSLALPRGTQRLRVRALGFAPLDTIVEVAGPVTLELTLGSVAAALASVTVAAAAEPSDIDPATPAMSVARLDLQALRRTPAVLGEVDPVRSLSLLPGVSRTSDFSSAFTVRGGGADQNLILLDEATVFNPAHIFGFLSVFNSDAVDDVTLYKGAIPSRFGGRLSSVLDVRQREGNAREYAGSASVGLLASRALAEGPLPFTRGSFLVAGRRSYADAFLGAASDSTVRDTRAYFYDLNAKVNVPLGRTGNLMFSQYAGRDVFGQEDLGDTRWGNRSATLRWNQIVGGRLFSKVSLNTSRYDYALGFDVVSEPVEWTSRIANDALRVDQVLSVAGQEVEFGGEVATLEIRPGDVLTADSAVIAPVRVEKRQAAMFAAYVGHKVDVGPRVTLHYGARWAAFDRLGPGTRYRYADDLAVRWNQAQARFEPGRLIDSTPVARGTGLAQFDGWEPRAALRVGLTPRASIKASYARTRQYLLLVSRTTSPTPLDVWEPAGPYLAPQTGDQVAVGYAATLADGVWDLSVEAYGKTLRNVADFADGSDVLLNPRVETAIVQGDGRAYGVEVLVRRNAGRTRGWLSYTAGRARQRVRAGADGGINGGAWYPSPTDKTHDFSLVAIRTLSSRWTVGSTVAVASGLPVTYPVARYQVDGLLVPEYGPRNGARLPLYHRLDVSLTRTGRRSDLQFGIYNLYNRMNAQSMTFRQVQDRPLATEAVQLSILGILPTISYTWRF
jgi:hypothetical protein